MHLCCTFHLYNQRSTISKSIFVSKCYFNILEGQPRQTIFISVASSRTVKFSEKQIGYNRSPVSPKDGTSSSGSQHFWLGCHSLFIILFFLSDITDSCRPAARDSPQESHFSCFIASLSIYCLKSNKQSYNHEQDKIHAVIRRLFCNYIIFCLEKKIWFSVKT